MKTLLFILLLIASACTPKKAKDPAPAPTEIGDTVVPEKDQTARNSLDYLGTYKGKFPCRDCSPTDVVLELSENFNYILTQTTAGKTTETKGTFKWDAARSGIVLSGTNITPNEFRVFEDRIVPRTDMQGNILKGDQGIPYEMRKLSEAEAIKTDEAPADKLPPTLTGIHWKLSEINGKPIKPTGDRDYHIQLNKDGSFGAFAGCNRMGGKYELKGSKVRMFNIISTMMACPDMTVEDQVKIALETADNFVANEKVLQFRKGGRNLLKFEANAIPKP